MARRAVFMDRDGTLVADPGFLKDPRDVTLLPGAAEAVALLSNAGYAVVIVTNQSGIGRGLLTENDYHRVQDRAVELLAREGATVAGTYFCPHSPDDDPPCDCRKPGTRLYREAQDDLHLDMVGSWWVGDRLSDVEPALGFGGKAVLVQTGLGEGHRQGALERGIPSAETVLSAARIIVDSPPPTGD